LFELLFKYAFFITLTVSTDFSFGATFEGVLLPNDSGGGAVCLLLFDRWGRDGITSA